MDSLEKQRKLLGINVLHYRMAAGFSQRELAAKAKTNQSVIWQIEKGLVGVRFDTICRIARVLNVRPKDLIDF